MTYRFSIAGFGRDRAPHIACDGCELVRSVAKANGQAAAWFLDGKAAPGWSMGRNAAGQRWDFCPSCKVKPVGAQKPGVPPEPNP